MMTAEDGRPVGGQQVCRGRQALVTAETTCWRDAVLYYT